MGSKKVNLKIRVLILLFGCVNLSGFNSSGKINILRENLEDLRGQFKRQSIEQSEKQLSGRAVYEKYCLTCHQSNGSGVPGMHPPLGPGSWVGKEPKDLIKILMEGLSGKIEVNDEVYKDNMPSQSKLTDDEIVEVLTYIRSNFGNNYKSVTPEMVKSVRANHLK
jgi:mono/diheme cytochrome c family protein